MNVRRFKSTVVYYHDYRWGEEITTAEPLMEFAPLNGEYVKYDDYYRLMCKKRKLEKQLLFTQKRHVSTSNGDSNKLQQVIDIINKMKDEYSDTSMMTFAESIGSGRTVDVLEKVLQEIDKIS